MGGRWFFGRLRASVHVRLRLGAVPGCRLRGRRVVPWRRVLLLVVLSSLGCRGRCGSVLPWSVLRPVGMVRRGPPARMTS